MEEKDFAEKQLTSEYIFDGRVVHLYKDTVALPNGKQSVREYIRHIGAVCVVPLTDDGNIICVRQYRYPYAKTLIEIPAGKLDYKGENPEEAAMRELREETGAVCRELIPLGEFYSSPAILDECIRMYLAKGLTFGETDFDEDELIEQVKVPAEELADMICRGEIQDGKTQAAVLKAVYMLHNNKI